MAKRSLSKKRLLLLSLKELYVAFTKRYGRKIELSKCSKLRLTWCIHVGGASCPHTVYVGAGADLGNIVTFGKPSK